MGLLSHFEWSTHFDNNDELVNLTVWVNETVVMALLELIWPKVVKTELLEQHTADEGQLFTGNQSHRIN